MKKLNVGLCSFGMSGWVFHAPFIHAHNGLNLYAVVERSTNNAIKKYPNIVTYKSIEDLLADDKVDVVIVNTPNTTHYSFTKKALLANKHVVVEKPFAVQAKQCNKLIKIANENNKVLTVFHNRRWDSDLLTVKKIVDSKVLGNIVEAELHFDRFSNALSYKQHKETPVKGVGIVYDLGVHLLDQAICLFGKPNKIFADIGVVRKISLVDDYMDITLFYSNGPRVKLKSSYQVKEPLPSFILHGSNGSFIKQRADTQETRLQNNEKPTLKNWGIEPKQFSGILHLDNKGKSIKKTIISQTGNYMHFYNGLHKAIVNGTALPVPAKEAAYLIKVIEKAYESSKKQKVIKL